MWKSIDVDIVREIDPKAIRTFENADAEDGILLNHSYIDMRGYSIADAEHVVAEEYELLSAIAAVEGDIERVDELIEQLYEDASELSGFDVGTAGTIFALSAAGAAPISSCNGGLLGEPGHSSQVPHILFSVELSHLELILSAADEAKVGVINNSGHVEVFAATIPALNAFAMAILRKLRG